MAELLLGSRVRLSTGSKILSSRLRVYDATNREKLSKVGRCPPSRSRHLPGQELDGGAFHRDSVRAFTRRPAVVPDLDAILALEERSDDAGVCSDSAVVILGDELSRVVGPVEFHHNVGLASGLDDVAAGFGGGKGEDILLAWYANLVLHLRPIHR